MLNFFKRLTRWAWADELAQLDTLVTEHRVLHEHCCTLRRETLGMETHLLVTKELFREKQSKITRLQQAYTAHEAPHYEDMRKEQGLANSTNLVALAASLPQRAARMARMGLKGRPSNGTVQGVPGDEPNVPVGGNWIA